MAIDRFFRLGIVAALPAEARCLGARVAPAGESVRLGDDVLLIRCGIGRARAERAAHDLVQAGAGALLSWGTAAALDPVLEPGDVVLARDVLTRDGRHFSVDEDWHRRVWPRVASQGRCHSGSVAESIGVLGSADDKLRLRTLSGASIADMESAAVAEVAHGAELPVLIIRAVSDSAATGIPVCAQVAVDENGDVDALRCLLHLTRGPSALPSLVGLARGFRAARARLTGVAERLGPDFLVTAAGRAEQSQA